MELDRYDNPLLAN